MASAAALPSPRRMRAISSGGYSTEPQSPGVMVAMWIVHPCSFFNRTRVPAQRNSASSGWARIAIAVFGMAAHAHVFRGAVDEWCCTEEWGFVGREGEGV